MELLQKIGAVPFDINVLQSAYPGCRQITDKARRLEVEGCIIRLKKGLYVAGANGGELSRELVANHLYGPSYVSMSWALRWYGLIPERVDLIQSVTTKHSRDFSNALGTFHYQNCAANYFPTQRIVILEYQTFNLLAVQMGYGKPMGIECKALRTIYFVS